MEQVKTIKNKNGITLIALVVTIVILIILATISINIIMNGGLIGRTQKGAELHRLQEEKERLEIIKGEVVSDLNHIGIVTVDMYIEELVERGIVKEEDIVDNGDGTKTVITDKGYSVTIEPVGDNDIKIIIDGKVGELPPKIKKVNLTRNETNLEIETVMLRTGGAKYSYFYKEIGAENWITLEESSNNDRITIAGTQTSKDYIVRVVASNEYGEDSKEVKTIPDVQFGNLIWSNGKASVTVTKTIEDRSVIEYNVVDSTGKVIREYQIIESGKTITELNHGDKINARLKEGTIYRSEASLEVRDTTIPNQAQIEVERATVGEGDAIVATITQSDDQSGVNYANSRWVLTDSSAKLGTTDTSKYTGGNFSKSPEEIRLIAESMGTFYLHILTVDYAGKATETVSTAITVVEGDPLPEPPALSDGMIPVKFVGNNCVRTTADDPEWYNYASSQKKWANVVLEDSTFDESTGRLDMNKPYSMLVWVPRYAYQITSYYHTQVPDEATKGNINVVFIDRQNQNKAKTKTYSTTYPSYTIGADTGMSDYVVHPAFNFGSNKLSGIWVGKYESNHRTCTTDETSGRYYKAEYIMTIRAGVTTWRRFAVGTMFDVCRAMNNSGNPYGLNTSDSVVDPHLMKNTEWGAVAYLSLSKYGKTGLIEYYQGNQQIAGAGGLNTTTTGNIYGIYDMSGNSIEMVAAYAGTPTGTDVASVVNADARYKNVYPASNYAGLGPSNGYFGDAMWETSGTSGTYGSWNKGNSVVINGNRFFSRNRENTQTKSAITGFGMDSNGGTYSNRYGFRVVLPVIREN